MLVTMVLNHYHYQPFPSLFFYIKVNDLLKYHTNSYFHVSYDSAAAPVILYIIGNVLLKFF